MEMIKRLIVNEYAKNITKNFSFKKLCKSMKVLKTNHKLIFHIISFSNQEERGTDQEYFKGDH